ncbi:VOC family protein [Altererythrobacter sp. CAU 1778]
MTSLAMTTYLVPDYDEAIAFFRDAIGFSVIEDTDMGGGKRWVVVGGEDGGRLLLARATSGEQRTAIGNQAGGRVGWFLHTADFAASHARMTAQGVVFHEQPRHEAYGTVAVFADPWGNRWDLIERKDAA